MIIKSDTCSTASLRICVPAMKLSEHPLVSLKEGDAPSKLVQCVAVTKTPPFQMEGQGTLATATGDIPCHKKLFSNHSISRDATCEQDIKRCKMCNISKLSRGIKQF